MSCDHCTATDAEVLPSDCFYDMYCYCCWSPLNESNEEGCANCANARTNTALPAHLTAPTGFNTNMASVLEENQALADNLHNSQVEYNGKWYFALDGQIYSVPYAIEIADERARRDIVTNWAEVKWMGSIFGNCLAWP